MRQTLQDREYDARSRKVPRTTSCRLGCISTSFLSRCSEDVTNAIRMCHKPNVMSLGQSHSSRYGDLGRSVFVRRRVVLPDHAGKTTGDDHQRAGTGGREMSDPLAIVLCRYR